MKKEILKVANEIDNFTSEIEGIKNNRDRSNEFKAKQVEEKAQDFKGFAEEQFSKAEKKLDRQAEEAKEKLQELQGGEYGQRQYEYLKAANEISQYDDPAKFLEDKKASASNEIELQEAMKAALGRAKASDPGTFEGVKAKTLDIMSEEEKAARRELAKTEILRQDLRGAKNALNYDFDEIKAGNVDTAKTSLIAHATNENLHRKADKKIIDTI